jgi:putative toxin-antitoxin system antitoxin component (TIGR02293 family)
MFRHMATLALASTPQRQRFVGAPPLERAAVVEAGFPAAVLAGLLRDDAVTLGDLSGLVAPRRTLERRLADGARLSADESDRLARFITVLDNAERLFGGTAAAMDWLRGPKLRFDGRRPLELLRTDAGTRLVEDVLEQARHGMMA